MKNIYLTGKSALAFLLSPSMKSFDQDYELTRAITSNSSNMMAYLDGLLQLPPAECLPNSAPAISHKEANQLVQALGTNLPLTVSVDAADFRRLSSTLHCVMHPAAAPTGSYIPLGDELYCATPALALLQEAPNASDIELIVLMSLLFGVFTHSDSADQPLAPRRKLLDKATLQSFASRCAATGRRQPKSLARVVKLSAYAIENVASPKEIESALRLGLPTDMGGCGYLKVKSNYPVTIPHTKRTRYIDLYWPDKNVGVEYDSALEHASREALETDALHRNDLAAAGVPCFYLTANQLDKLQLFNRAAKQIGNALNAAKFPDSAAFHDKQRALTADIQGALHRYGF